MRTTNGEDGTMVLITYYTEGRLIVLAKTEDGEPVKWPDGDDKRCAPVCIRNEDDFRDVVYLFADMLDLGVVRVADRTYGPAYRLVEK